MRARWNEPFYDATMRAVARRILPLLYFGNRVGCPCCGGRFRCFIPRYRDDLLCPRCLALRRHRWFWLFLQERLGEADEDLAILHIAPEEGISERLRSRPRARYVTADLNPRSGADLTFDVTAIPFPDRSFGLVLCNHVLEHVEDDRAAMHELFRVLAPGGSMYSMHPVSLRRVETIEDPELTDPDERLRLFGLRDHVRLYGRDFIGRLEEAGFEVVVHEYRPAPAEVAFYGLRERHRVFLCRRPQAPSRS